MTRNQPVRSETKSSDISRQVALPFATRPRLAIARSARDFALGSARRFEASVTSPIGARVVAAHSAVAALETAQRALRGVPAYRSFVRASGWSPGGARLPQDILASLPETTKRNYVDAFSTDERCVGGHVPSRDVEIDESSGSSGRPYSWVRSTDELREMRRSLSRLAGFLLGDNLVTLNGFSMGAWATGTNVSAALAANGLLKSTGPDPGKILTAMELLGPERHYVITGYPPFLLDLLEFADRQGFPIEKYKMSGIVGGEAMSETLRRRLNTRFDVVYSAYGASDLDIGVAAELPLSIWIRQRCAENSDLAQTLFGDARRLPMLFQYDPLDYYVERNDSGELVVTVNRPSVLSPRVRYNVKDAGGAIPFDHMIRICRDFGFDPLRDAPHAVGGDHPRLPFLYISGRSDSTLSFFGANIYPEDVEQAIFGDSPDAASEGIRGFALELIEERDATVHPCVHIERAQGTRNEAHLATVLGERVRTRLAANSRDYRVALGEDPRAGDIEIRLHDFETGPFDGQGERIKRRYVLTAQPAPKTGTKSKLSAVGTATGALAASITDLPARHRGALGDALRAPSAHNAQPWRVIALADVGRYELHYDHTEYLPHDPDDRDAFLTMGAFVETLCLVAPHHQLRAEIEPVLTRTASDLFVARVTLRDSVAGDATDPLSAHVAMRAMNRNSYVVEPINASMASALKSLGNVLVDPKLTSRIVGEASAYAWADRQFVTDLHRWYRTDPNAADGFTAKQMHMRKIDLPSFWVARNVGRVPRPLNHLFATRDVQMVRNAPALAVLGSDNPTPQGVFDAGRRMLRSWVTLTQFGYSCHPFSIAIDVRQTAPKIGSLAGLAHPMALYRIGRTEQTAWATSNRRPLAAVLRSPEDSEAAPERRSPAHELP